MEWQIFYDDDSTFSSEDGGPEAAPCRGVIAIVCRDPGAGFLVCSRFDFYHWREDGWYGGEFVGLIDYLFEPGWKTVKFGRTIDNQKFQEIHARAAALKDRLKAATDD
jgi:hypothetical protein